MVIVMVIAVIWMVISDHRDCDACDGGDGDVENGDGDYHDDDDGVD